MDLLPEELFVDILRRLPPRPLAVCRTVSKGLRTIIDGRGFLEALEHRVPRYLHGILINYVGQDRPYFFSRNAAAAAPRIDGEFHFLGPIGRGEIEHHCNGLVLFSDRRTLLVCNPATRRWAELPKLPEGGGYSAHLIFDPTISLHYEVISFSMPPCKPNSSSVNIKGSVQWPPSSYVAQVFSSRTGRWEERTYVREDDVAVTLLDVWSDPWGVDSETLSYHAPRCNAVCWRGAFYLHCNGGFVMRLSLLEHKYKVIKTPNLDNLFTLPRLVIDKYLRRESSYMSKEECSRYFQMDQKALDRKKPKVYFGKSEHGIYYTALCWYQLQVWALCEVSESRPMPEWELKHKADIEPSFLQHYTSREDREEIQMSWSLDRGKERSDHDLVDYGWDSSDDSAVIVEGEEEVPNRDRPYYTNSHIDLLGYHPSKDIAFFGNHFDGFAYNLGSSKLQYLGTFDPVGCCHYLVAATHESFIYTPCMDDLLPEQKRNTRHELDDDDDDEEEEEEEYEEDNDNDYEDDDDYNHEDDDYEEEVVGIGEDVEEVEDEDVKGLEKGNNFNLSQV